ncbi:DUF4352 domain-containing protein [Catenulispora subtropica]|uniref:DUF4352 domain-containing protein n=1 Tax=Catenulispora subtropica TaxID=450798 RepID=A0ABN2T9R3_9ACTN
MSRKFGTIGATAAAALLAAGAAACQSSTQATKVGSDAQSVQTSGTSAAGSASPSTSAPAAKTFKVGDQVQNGKWIVTVHKADVPFTPKNDFDKPKDGDMFVVLDVEVKNTSGSAQDFSSMLGFELKDGANQTYDETILAEDGMPAVPEGSVAAGEAKRGEVAFEVPKTAKGLKLEFRGGVMDGQVAIDLGH